jgi:hypothetical protein
MAGTGEVTLGASRHLPAHGIARRARSREHGASQAEEERLNRSFFWSQAEVRLLHAQSLARGEGHATKHVWLASHGPGLPLCGQPNNPMCYPFYIFVLQGHGSVNELIFHARGLDHLGRTIGSSSGWSHRLAFELLRRSTGRTARFMDFAAN